MELTEEEFKNRIELLEKAVLDKKGTVSGLAPEFGLVAASVVEFLKRNGKKHLLEIKDSTPQRQIQEFLNDELNEKLLYNNRKLIEPLELDIFVPSLNLAIEFCGIYWHSEIKKEKNYHFNKLSLCRKKGIRLITIFEDEWYERKNQVKNYLLSVINKNSIKIGARQTDIKNISIEEASKFLNQTHIQGSGRIEKAFGLYYQDNLVGIITGSKHHRQGFENIYVLNRLSFCSNVSIVGGASKLLEALKQYAKSNGYIKLISWSDNRWSEGNVYKKLNFELEEEFGPDYSYVKGATRMSKQSCQKKFLIKRGANGNTENEMAISLGYSRIWDCGKKRWALKLI